MNKLKVFEGFAGFGGASFALKKISEKHPKFKYKVVAFSEIDKYATEMFNLNHKDLNGNLIKNYGDITKIDPKQKNFEKFDLFTGGFPCQPFSTAGMQLGTDDPYGRGSLFEHIYRICKEVKPQYILLENVKGILSKKFKHTRDQMQIMLREIGYTSNKADTSELPLRMISLNSKDYGIPQNRERVWMFAKLGGLPKDFSMEPPKIISNLRVKDFLDPEDLIPKEMYLSDEQIQHLKFKHKIDSFKVKEPLCFDVYNKKIKIDGYSITITLPEHNSLRIIESHENREVVRKMTTYEQFRLMGLEGLEQSNKRKEIDFGKLSYTQISRRAGNGWDVNLVTILLEHIFKQLDIIWENENING